MQVKLNILAVVALTEDIPSKYLSKGEVGTIVEHLEAGVYDVEFADNLGRTYALASLREDQLMLLYTSPAPELLALTSNCMPKIIHFSLFFGILISLFIVPISCSQSQSPSDIRARMEHYIAQRTALYKLYYENDYDERYYDSLGRLSVALSHYLKQTLPLTPSALSGPFDPIGKNYTYEGKTYIAYDVRVASSPDGKMRIWTWNTETGGSMISVQNIVAYQTTQGIKVIDLEEDLGWGPKDRGGNKLFDTIFTIVRGNSTIYLPRASWIADGRNSGLSLHAFAIDADTLNTELEIFPAPSYSDKQWDVELDAACEDCNVPQSKLLGDEIYVQHIGTNSEESEELTSKWDVYKFDGKHFVFKGIQE